MHHDQIMKSYTPLNNYLTNCEIKLHIKLHPQPSLLFVKELGKPLINGQAEPAPTFMRSPSRMNLSFPQ
jgi:hypothetical protein